MKRTIAISITAMLLLASCATKTEGVSLGILQTIDSKATVASNVDSAMESEAVEEEWDIVSNDAIPTDDRFEEQISATDDGKDEPSDRIEAVVQPIVRHYTYEGYDFSLSAYPGRLYLVHPEELGGYEIDLLASYLMQRHPQQLKDVTYSESNGVLTLTYPESWTVAELDYAQSVLMEVLSEFDEKNVEARFEAPAETQMQEQFEEASEDAVAEDQEGDIASDPSENPMATPQPFVEDQSSVLASEKEWWNDPIFEGSYDPIAEIGSMQTEGHSEIQESEGTIDLEAFDWTVDDVPEEHEEKPSVPIEAFEAIESKAILYDGDAEEQRKESFADKAKAVLSKAKDSAMRFKDSALKALDGMSFEDMVFVGLVVLFAVGILVVLLVVRSKRKRSDKEFEGGSFDA